MRIVTGHTGEPHITSNDQMGLHQGIVGTGNYVLNVGEKFAATLTNANTVSISDGEGVMQGVHFRVLPGTVDTVSIDNGTTGYNRIDLICARYTKTEGTGIESVEWAVVKGTPTASTPAEPEYNEGDILGGDLIADFPMFKVTFNGITPSLSNLTNLSTNSLRIRSVSELSALPKIVHNAIYLNAENTSSYDQTTSPFDLEKGMYIIPVSFHVSPAESGTSSKVTTVEWFIYSGETGTNVTFQDEFEVRWDNNENNQRAYRDDTKYYYLNVDAKFRVRLKISGTGNVTTELVVGEIIKIKHLGW